MKLSDFRYPLPRNLVAKFPASPRESARMMVVNRSDESITTRRFSDIAQLMKRGDCLIVNETKVFPARLFGRKEKTNARIEVFLLREQAGVPFKEIAGLTGVNENTVKSRMRYALERLQETLSEYEEYARALR